MSLFDELFAKFKEQQENKDQEKIVPSVTCVYEENIVYKDLKRPSASPAQVTIGTKPTPDLQPGNCEECPAYGFWEGRGPEPFCFYEAYSLAKPAKPELAKTRQPDCPLQERESDRKTGG